MTPYQNIDSEVAAELSGLQAEHLALNKSIGGLRVAVGGMTWPRTARMG